MHHCFLTKKFCIQFYFIYFEFYNLRVNCFLIDLTNFNSKLFKFKFKPNFNVLYLRNIDVRFVGTERVLITVFFFNPTNCRLFQI